MIKKIDETPSEAISREEAIKKAGKYAVFTAAATMLFLTPKAMALGSPNSPGTGYRDGGPVAPTSSGRSNSPFTKNKETSFTKSPWH